MIDDFADFCNNRQTTVEYYEQLDRISKRVLKNYIYGLRIATFKKDLIWEYLNGYVIEEDFVRTVIGIMPKQHKKIL